jgi:integrase/recombinase XerD
MVGGSQRVSGALAPYERGFAGELSRQGYTPGSAAQQLSLMSHVGRWLVGEGLDAEGLTPDVGDRYLAARRAAGYRTYPSSQALVPLVGYLRGLGVVPPAPLVVAVGPVEVLLERYRCYLTSERGLVHGTIRNYVELVRPFLTGRVTPDGLDLDLEGLRRVDVMAFVLARCPSQSQGRAKLTVRALRSLLRFLHVEGLVCDGLTGTVPSVAGWRLTGLPRALEPGQAGRLLASCDLQTTAGRRDFAILTILARLGLRRGEVAALRLEDVDWSAGEILVRGKGDRHERLPLPADVGETVAGYLCRGRPSSAEGRSLFVRVTAPHRAMTPSAIGAVVAAAGFRAGLGNIGTHRLRHTVATEMLRAGAPLPEIGQVLRHRTLGTTAIYAKVDRDALRSLARPWIGGAA